MASCPPGDLTALLGAWRRGDAAALPQLIPLVYVELKRVAHRYMRDERPNHLLQTTALVHEAFLRFKNVNRIDWQNRTQFFAVSAQLMRRILVDAARRRNAVKRGGVVFQVSLDKVSPPGAVADADLLALNEALDQLAALAPRKVRVVELRCFGGLSVEETADVLGVSVQTVMRDWRMAKLWLRRALARSPGVPPGDAP